MTNLMTNRSEPHHPVADSPAVLPCCCRVPEASADELDELQVLGVSVKERSEGLCEGDEALAQAVAKVALRPLLEGQLRALLEALKSR